VAADVATEALEARTVGVQTGDEGAELGVIAAEFVEVGGI
jgi:hypothetical protein